MKSDASKSTKRDLRSYSSWSSSSTKVTAFGGRDLKHYSSSSHLSSIQQQKSQYCHSVSHRNSSTREKEDIKILYEKDLAILYQLPIKRFDPAKINKHPPLIGDNSPPNMNSYDLTQKIVIAKGHFSIYKILGQTAAYIKCGQFVHPILPRLRLWRVLKDQFLIPQPNPGRFWRLEIPDLETENPASIVELELKLNELCAYKSLYKGDRSEESIKASLERHLELDPLGFPLISENEDGNTGSIIEEFEDDNEYDTYLQQWVDEFSSDYDYEEDGYEDEETDNIDTITVQEESNNRYSTAASTLDFYLDSFDGFNVVSGEAPRQFNDYNRDKNCGSGSKAICHGSQEARIASMNSVLPLKVQHVHHHHYHHYYRRPSIRDIGYSQFDNIYETRPDMIDNKKTTDNSTYDNINSKNKNEEVTAYWERVVSKMFSWTK